MKKILFYDTETTGLPNWKKPSDDESQPHLVQLAAILCNAETEEVISSIDLTIKPEGWEIPEEVSEIHGVTTEKAKAVGVPENLAFQMLYAMFEVSDIRVAHNRTFDQRIIRIAAKRHGTEPQTEAWAEKEDHECTMLLSKPICKLPNKGRKGIKNPKLEEAYEQFTGEQLENAHTAIADAQGCMDIYFFMKNNSGESSNG
ncbi:3'-5' exonuclease [Deltaproteobacteria bacterium]|nr:3'-5' exonuclease [Deltaproteobacteria bacterium]